MADATINAPRDPMVSMTADKAGPKAERAVRSVRIEPADGGFIVTVDKDSDVGAGTMPKPHVCKDPAELHAYLDEALGTAPAPPVEPVAEDVGVTVDAYEAPEAATGFAQGPRA